MANYASTVIAIATAEVGYLEKKSNSNLYSKKGNAGSANYTKYGYEMHKIYPSVMDFPAAWCDCFVDWCFNKAYGTSNAKGLLGGDFNDYTVASAQLYKNKKAYYKRGNTPKIGDQIFFTNGTRICHTGFVYDVDSKYVYTIEGNTSSGSEVIANGGGVYKKKYLLTNTRIDGYGRPKYDAESTSTSSTLDYSLVFDATYYASKYPDLKAAGITTATALKNHFINHGMSEARQAISTFNVVKYKSYYTDLQNAFGDDWVAYYKHYINYGHAEGRKCV